MKKILALLLALGMTMSAVACTSTDGDETEDTTGDTTVETNDESTPAEETDADTESDTEADTDAETDAVEADVKGEGVMTYAEYAAAELDTEVVVETYVQAKQGWWTDDQGISKATFYTQDKDGGYYLYDMPCSEEEYNQLTAGAKIKVTGYKSEWQGEVEIIDATFEILEGNYVAEPVDVTDKLGTDDLINYQNQFVSFKGVTIEAVEYKNGEPGDDIYVTVGYNGASYSFCVESYFMGPDTEVYQTVGTLNVGDVVDVEGFLYWYQGVNTHITSVVVK